MKGKVSFESAEGEYVMDILCESDPRSEGSALTALRRFLAGRLPSDALPTCRFSPALACGFALGFRTSPITFITLARLDLGLGPRPLIRGE
jgi:hypothetical protein